MKTLVWILVLGGLASVYLTRLARRRRLSSAWLADNQRREWGSGHESAAWNWNSAPAALMAFRDRERK